MASIDARIDNAKVSQLALAAPLESSSQPTRLAHPVPEAKKPSPDPAPESKDPPNQKAGLLVALLSVGALRPALALLTKFRWLVDAYPEILHLFIHMMKHSHVALRSSSFGHKTAQFI